jgi:predicted GNAT superfamily acetyltransferase
LQRGIATIRWTFDPLVRRNAFFNLHKLGAVVTDYLPDFYGEMRDDINAGDATDRLYVLWELSSPRAVRAAAGASAETSTGDAVAAGAVVWLDRVDGEPVARGRRREDVVLVAVAEDVERLRHADPGLALRWRTGVRDALVTALDGEYQITTMTRDGWYVLESSTHASRSMHG